MNSLFPAHIRDDESGKTIQTVAEHCRATGRYAAGDLLEIGLPQTGMLLGLLHDMGKSKEEFKFYIEASAEGDASQRRGSVNHSFAGCRWILKNFHAADALGFSEVAAELLAYAIAAHHGQFDCLNEAHESGLLHREQKPGIGYEESVQNFLEQCAPESELNDLFHASAAELTAVMQKCIEMASADGSDAFQFYLGLLARLLLSALIDGDRRDTAEFMNRVEFPPLPGQDARKEMWASLLHDLEAKLDEFPQDSEIQKARRQISDQCAAYGDKPGGIIRLKVPTGGGKTISSFRYALAHAARWNKSRIILTSSLLSILDQNAKVIRSLVADQSLILEHHSNAVQPKAEEDQIRWELMTEQWNSPIIITTLVQLLNTLFDGRTGCIRRFQALSNSIIVVDEAQTVPANLLTLFNLALNFLAEVCGATVVLCSATQPALENAHHPLLRKPPEMVPMQEELWQVFQRTRITDVRKFRLEEIPGFVEQVLEDTASVLVVCNKKDQAEALFRALEGTGQKCFHLSAAMCMEHRRKVLTQMQEALDAKQEKVICVSTQVIEAGVDISFGRVIRLAAGMDSIVQSAGRCNRNGEQAEPAPVYVVDCTDEKLTHLQEIADGKKASLGLINAFAKHPEQLDHDLTSDAAIKLYFTKLYSSMDPHSQDGTVPKKPYTLFDLLGTNEHFYSSENPEINRYQLHQAFRTAGDEFTVFDQNTTSVLVPYGDGKRIWERLIAISQDYTWDFDEINQLVQQAKGYMVSVYSYQKETLQKQGAWMELFDGRITVLTDGYYDENLGFTTKETLLEV